jgi:hypothetical protein
VTDPLDRLTEIPADDPTPDRLGRLALELRLLRADVAHLALAIDLNVALGDVGGVRDRLRRIASPAARAAEIEAEEPTT